MFILRELKAGEERRRSKGQNSASKHASTQQCTTSTVLLHTQHVLKHMPQHAAPANRNSNTKPSE